MKPITIAGANANPGAPAGWDPKKDGECGRLPIRVTYEDDGRHIKSCESAWQPTDQELELLKNGGHVVLYVVGWQVPVALSVEAAEAPSPPEAKSEGAQPQ